MRGINRVWVSGNVGSVVFNQTKNRGDDVCSFMLASEDRFGEVTWVRVNVYGPLVNVCKSKLEKGIGVEVEGKLMERLNSHGSKILEIRCKNLEVVKLKYKEISDGTRDGGDWDRNNESRPGVSSWQRADDY